MPVSELFADRFGLRCAVFALAMVAAVPTFADDTEKNPWAVFKFGFSAYKQGDKQSAAEAYRYAADNGVAGARWKLAQMYASGDGVQRDDFAAFQMFADMVRMGATAGSRDESYIAAAHVALANYLKSGIPGTSVAANPALAHDLYMRAATYYGSPEAQFELGRSILEQGQDDKAVTQAARWLKLAVKEGHAGAEALLGDLYVRSGRVVRGLAMLTAALQRAKPKDRDWIQAKQEGAFALASEADRRTAIALSQSGNASE